MVVNQSLPNVMIGIAIFLSPLFFLLCRKKHGRFRIRLKEAAIVAATWVGAFLLIFVVCLFVVTPKKLVTTAREDRNAEHTARIKAEGELEKANIELHAMTPGEQSQKISWLQSSVDTLGKKLEVANATISRQQSELDPLSKPIASAKFSVLINFQSLKEKASRYLGGGAAVALAKGTNALLEASAVEHFSDGDGHSRFLMDCAFDAPYMGKPTRALAETEYIQLYFRDTFAPIGIEISGGKVVLLINNQITLNFDIPAQTVSQQQDGYPVIVIRDVQKGLQPLLTPPSESVPDKATSPH